MAMRSVFLLAAVLSALSGCAAASEGTPAAPSSASPQSASPQSASPQSASASAVPVPSQVASNPSGPAAGMSVSGEVVEGVEAGCLLLQTPGTLYLLLGGDRTALQVGKRVTVVGNPQPDLMSTCQQGTPFQVVSVRSG